MQQIKVSLYKYVDYGFLHTFTCPTIANLRAVSPETEWLRFISTPRAMAEKFRVSDEAFVLWRNSSGTYYAIAVPDRSRGRFQQITVFVGQNVIAEASCIISVLRILKNLFSNINANTSVLVENIVNTIKLVPNSGKQVPSTDVTRKTGVCCYKSEQELYDVVGKVQSQSVNLFKNVWFVRGNVDTSEMEDVTLLNDSLNNVASTEAPKENVVETLKVENQKIETPEVEKLKTETPKSPTAPKSNSPANLASQNNKPSSVSHLAVKKQNKMLIILLFALAGLIGISASHLLSLPSDENKDALVTSLVVEQENESLLEEEQTALEVEDVEYLKCNDIWKEEEVKSEKYKALVNAFKQYGEEGYNNLVQKLDQYIADNPDNHNGYIEALRNDLKRVPAGQRDQIMDKISNGSICSGLLDLGYARSVTTSVPGSVSTTDEPQQPCTWKELFK